MVVYAFFRWEDKEFNGVPRPFWVFKKKIKRSQPMDIEELEELLEQWLEDGKIAAGEWRIQEIDAGNMKESEYVTLGVGL